MGIFVEIISGVGGGYDYKSIILFDMALALAVWWLSLLEEKTYGLSLMTDVRNQGRRHKEDLGYLFFL
jgi:hypothetical protein